MKKLIHGILDFRKNLRPEYRQTFARLALEQKPDSLFIACSDSRVVPNLFASTDPGDLFVLRNVGNLIPPCGVDGMAVGDESEGAAIEFALTKLNVNSVIICGHSECGAMHAALTGREQIQTPNLRSWLKLVNPALDKLKKNINFAPGLAPHNVLSQINVLEQLRHLETYPAVRERIEKGELTIHGWWFDIAHADVHVFDEAKNAFVIIDEKLANQILRKVELGK